jgi:hypothetical protein
MHDGDATEERQTARDALRIDRVLFLVAERCE